MSEDRMISDFEAGVEQARNGHESDAMTAGGHTNGFAAPAPKPSALPVQGRRTQEIGMPAPYKGYRFTAWMNYPKALAEDLSSDDRQIRNAAFSRIFLSHNGWPHPETGEELPQWEPGNVEQFRAFSDEIPQELFLAMQAAVGADVGNVAMAVQEARKRR